MLQTSSCAWFYWRVTVLFFVLEDTYPRNIQKHSFFMRGIPRVRFIFRKKTWWDFIYIKAIKQKVRHLAPFSRSRFFLFNVPNKLVCLVLLKRLDFLIYKTFLTIGTPKNCRVFRCAMTKISVFPCAMTKILEKQMHKNLHVTSVCSHRRVVLILSVGCWFHFLSFTFIKWVLSFILLIPIQIEIYILPHCRTSIDIILHDDWVPYYP